MKTRTYIFEAVCCALFFLFIVTGAPSQAQTLSSEAGQLSGTLRTAFYYEVMIPGFEVPDWDRGYVIHHEDEENYSADTAMVAMYDATGMRIRQGRIWPEGAGSVRVRVTAATQEGAILAAGLSGCLEACEIACGGHGAPLHAAVEARTGLWQVRQ